VAMRWSRVAYAARGANSHTWYPSGLRGRTGSTAAYTIRCFRSGRTFLTVYGVDRGILPTTCHFGSAYIVLYTHPHTIHHDIS